MVFGPQGIREELVSSVSERLGAVRGHKCGRLCHLQGGPSWAGEALEANGRGHAQDFKRSGLGGGRPQLA